MGAQLLRKASKHYRFEPPDKRGKGALEFWAESGFVCMIDERLPQDNTKHFTVLTRREFLERLRSINEGIGRIAYEARVSASASGGNSNAVAAEMRESLHNLISNGMECAKIARSQGDPTNAKHAADMLKERQRRSIVAGFRPVKLTGVVDSAISAENDLLPPLPKQPSHGRLWTGD